MSYRAHFTHEGWTEETRSGVFGPSIRQPVGPSRTADGPGRHCQRGRAVYTLVVAVFIAESLFSKERRPWPTGSKWAKRRPHLLW